MSGHSFWYSIVRKVFASYDTIQKCLTLNYNSVHIELEMMNNSYSLI